eukprot:CAMPEP_0172486180 /NCGR_PEP_ID=MMETSP1066-20121228/14653_1 /TAXON_ID=671091 /ORGANISM="Coscinodiscus wailesii, Strain CCMP2513" /LENGTH=222 /DNA_ID=CAMNT_0013251973 /DNA_START=100 /DNA_END=768 /DNA_ORIENTATION=+
MNHIYSTATTLLIIFSLATTTAKKDNVRKLGKSTKRSKSREIGASCTREVYSVVAPNDEWSETHEYHNQVWYHSLKDINALWKDEYFDYVLDTRSLQDSTKTLSDGSKLLLEGWETVHIPESYPLGVPGATPAAEVDMLVDFTSSNVCKDSRIFVHCWSGTSANMVAKTLIELGFTNVHVAGPAGTAGIWDWINAGYEVVKGDKFDPNEKRFHPECMKHCEV